MGTENVRVPRNKEAANDSPHQTPPKTKVSLLSGMTFYVPIPSTPSDVRKQKYLLHNVTLNARKGLTETQSYSLYSKNLLQNVKAPIIFTYKTATVGPEDAVVTEANW